MADPMLIAGGGIAGLATALALARAGFPTTVLERSAAFKEIGAGIQLGPNALAMLRELGVIDRVLADAFVPQTMVMRDAMTGRDIFRGPLGEAVDRRFGSPYVVTHRADLLDALLQACAARDDITLRTNACLESFEETATGVTVRLVDGERIDAPVLIAADGLWSTVRGALIGDGPPRVSGHLAFRAVLPIEAVPAHLRTDDVTLWAGPKSHVATYKLRRGELFNLVAVFHSNRYVEGWDVAGDRDELLDHFREVTTDVRDLLGLIESWRMWVLCDREPIRGWARGRVTLLGDAAHPMLQYLAQGAAMSLEDAVCLASCVHGLDPKKADDVASAFAAFEERRYLRTARVQLYARFYGELYHATGVAREVRNEMVGTNARGLEAMAWLYTAPSFDRPLSAV